MSAVYQEMLMVHLSTEGDCNNRKIKHNHEIEQNEKTSARKQRSVTRAISQLTNKFECEDTLRHSPFDIILLCRCAIIPCQQVYLHEDRMRGFKRHSLK